MNDREIRERLRRFESVWQRVRGEDAPRGNPPAELMPRRRQTGRSGCRRPSGCPRKPR